MKIYYFLFRIDVIWCVVFFYLGKLLLNHRDGYRFDLGALAGLLAVGDAQAIGAEGGPAGVAGVGHDHRLASVIVPGLHHDDVGVLQAVRPGIEIGAVKLLGVDTDKAKRMAVL